MAIRYDANYNAKINRVVKKKRKRGCIYQKKVVPLQAGKVILIIGLIIKNY